MERAIERQAIELTASHSIELAGAADPAELLGEAVDDVETDVVPGSNVFPTGISNANDELHGPWSGNPHDCQPYFWGAAAPASPSAASPSSFFLPMISGSAAPSTGAATA